MNATPRLTIGKLAKDAGVGVETIRFYERKGILKRPKRGLTSFREYSPEDATRIRFVKRTQDLGFTLSEIKKLLELHMSRGATCQDVKARADRKIEEIDAKIRDLRKMKRSLTRLSEACDESRSALGECPVMDCFESGFQC